MKVSVLIPVYKVEKYIAQCAESLFRQTYKDVEYVFVNDCTPDNSIEILKDVLEKFPERKSQVHVISQSRNRGLGAARLVGLGHATGDFIMIVDSDDIVPFDAIEKLVRKQAETNADMVDGGTDSVMNGKFTDVQLPYKGNRYIELLIIQNVMNHSIWGRLIRRSIFTENDINFKEGVNQAEDYSIIPRVAYYAKRTWIDDVVYHYRIDRLGTFTDGISQKHVKSFLEANRIINDFFKDKGEKYQYPLHVGLINVSYHAVNAGKTIAEVNEALDYAPKGLLFKLSVKLLSHKATVRLAKLEYLILKRLYLTF